MSLPTAALLACVLAVSGAAPEPFGLVIGHNAAGESPLPPLRHADDDAVQNAELSCGRLCHATSTPCAHGCSAEGGAHCAP